MIDDRSQGGTGNGGDMTEEQRTEERTVRGEARGPVVPASPASLKSHACHVKLRDCHCDIWASPSCVNSAVRRLGYHITTYAMTQS